MSKKNSKKRRAVQLQYDKEREKERQEKIQKAAAKASAKNMSQPKPGKRKTIRLRKNTVVRGIKIRDSESKKQVMELLKAEQANTMDVEDVPSRLVVANAGRMRRATASAAASKGLGAKGSASKGLGVKSSGGVQKKRSSTKAVAMMID